MGEGIGKVLSMLLAIASSKDATVLIDEFDNGLHYSVMREVWSAVARIARDFNVQLITTSHSWECLVAAHEFFCTEKTYDLRIHRLDRRADWIDATEYNQKQIEMAIASGMELR